MSADNVHQLKQRLRGRIRDAVKALSPAEIARQSSIITTKVTSLSAYTEASSLAVFLSMPGREVATNDIVKRAFSDGKRVYVPYIHASKTDPKSKIMDMLRLVDEDDLNSLKPDAWGIPSLPEQSVNDRDNALGGKGCLGDVDDYARDMTKLDLILMPSVAFDGSLNRLGHGKGFYDRYLAFCQSRLSSRIPNFRMPHLVGLALKEQVLPPSETLPAAEHDWKVDQVVTAEEE